ncbi:MAG: tetratricopeptide repeat protein, partial [Dactylosporangium sp.]|nr:tetratricopeptide repeat protein [Dactylosporangium sp.]
THATTLGWLAQAQLSTGDYGASLRTARQAVAAYRAVGNAPDERAAGLAWVLQLLAHSAERAGEIDEARAALGEAVELCAALAARNDASRAYHAAVLAAWFDLLTRHGRADEAGDVAVAAAPRLRDYPPSAAVCRLLCGAAAAHNRAGRLDEARSVIDDAVRVAVSVNDNAGLVQALILRARSFEKSNNLYDAISTVDEAIAALPSRASVDPVPANDTDVLVHGYRAELLASIGDLPAAEASAREAVVIGRAVKGSQHLGPVLAGFAQILRDQHRHDEAARVGAEAAQMYRAAVARDSSKTPRLLACLRLRAHDLVAIGRADEAIPDVEEALEAARRLRGSDAEVGIDELARSLRIAARVYAAADRLNDAIGALRTLRDLAREHPTDLRRTLARAAFTEALRAAPQTLPGAWEAVTQQPYPGENAPT